MLTSVGVIIGAVAIYFTGWSWIDPAISAGIGLFIFPRTWKLLKESVSILLEGTPAELNVEDLRRKLAEIAGVSNIHDLHVWVLTSEMYAMTVHAVAADIDQHVRILRDVERLARESFEIHHVTVQLEPAGYSHEFMHD
jgi:cobalt-zinc-cadmium efflux system protein